MSSIYKKQIKKNIVKTAIQWEDKEVEQEITECVGYKCNICGCEQPLGDSTDTYVWSMYGYSLQNYEDEIHLVDDEFTTCVECSEKLKLKFKKLLGMLVIPQI